MGLVGNLAGLHHAECPLLLSIVIRQSNLPACVSEVQLDENALWHLNAMELGKLIDKMDEICINGKWSVQEPNALIFCVHLWIVLLYFSPESRLISRVVILGQVRLFWKLIRSRIWQVSHSCHTGILKYFPGSFAWKWLKYEDRMSIVGQNYIFCGHNMVSPAESMDYVNIWLLVMWLNWVRCYWPGCCN